MITTSELLALRTEIESAFPTVEDERALYLLEGSAPRVLFQITATRVSEPDATIFVVSDEDEGDSLKRLLHAGADGVFNPRQRSEREALLRGVAVHVARSGRQEGGVAQACRALRSLLVAWNQRMVLSEGRELAA